MTFTSQKAISRLRMIKKELLGNRNTASIVEQYRTKWDVGESTVYAYIAEAHRQWNEEAKKMPSSFRITQRRMQFEMMLEECMLERDWNNAIKALTQLAKIDACYPADRVEFTQKLDALDDRTKERKLKDLLEERDQWLKDAKVAMEASN